MKLKWKGHPPVDEHLTEALAEVNELARGSDELAIEDEPPPFDLRNYPPTNRLELCMVVVLWVGAFLLFPAILIGQVMREHDRELKAVIVGKRASDERDILLETKLEVARVRYQLDGVEADLQRLRESRVR